MVIALQAGSALMEAALLDPSIDRAASADAVRQFVRRRPERPTSSVHSSLTHRIPARTRLGVCSIYILSSIAMCVCLGGGGGAGRGVVALQSRVDAIQWPLLRLNDHRIWAPQDLTV